MIKDPNLDFQKFKKNPRIVLWWMYARLTAKRRAFPEFIIAGTARAGTTSLFQYLSDHPNIFPPLRKEIKYFDCNYFMGKDWYQAHFPFRKKLYDHLGITGEASPNYLMHPSAMQRIAAALPKTKIILLLRNPVDRAFSHYKLSIKAGEESLSFEDAILAEPDRLKGEEEKIARDDLYPQATWIKHSYLTRGQYIEQLPKVFQLFDATQVLILRSEDFYSNPGMIFQQTIAFLGVPSWDPHRYDVFKPSTDKSHMTDETRRKLIAHFRPYNQRLYELLGRDFEWDI